MQSLPKIHSLGDDAKNSLHEIQGRQAAEHVHVDVLNVDVLEIPAHEKFKNSPASLSLEREPTSNLQRLDVSKRQENLGRQLNDVVVPERPVDA